MKLTTRIIGKRKSIALVAHDHKKASLVAWALRHKDLLAQHELLATGTTGNLIEQSLGQPVTKMYSGPLGGDQQLGARIADGKIDVMIFFWDPMEAQPHDSDVKALLRVAVAWNVIIANDPATADFIVSSPFMNGEYEAEVPDYTEYLNRQVKGG
ncbi:MAG TPA: methylglyoxal synthase [Chitinophagaceae bacterium]